jgi:glutamyl-tRNA reductase
MKILLLGLNHETAAVEVREHFAPQDPGPALVKLVTQDEIHEAVLVTTCNRVDLVLTTDDVEAALMQARRFFAQELGRSEAVPGGARFEDISYEHRDAAAVNHVFRVASSLDSMVVGEPQILGQMKEAYRLAVEKRACGPVLSRLFQRAFATAKRVKNETRIAQRPVSVARVAVDLARQIFEDLEGKRALLIGAGEMIELSLMGLQREGLGSVHVANRTLAHAEELARRTRASAHGLEELDELLSESDVVLTCIGGEQPLVSKERLERALQSRRGRPIFLIDMGVPRNIDPRVDEIDSAYLYDLDDLQSVASENVDKRVQESQRGESIVRDEQQRFEGWMMALKAVPTIRHLRARTEAIRKSELSRMAGRLGLDDRQSQAVEALTRGIVNKILHAPLAHLREEAESESGIAALEAARSLFGLDDAGAPGAQADPELRRQLERERLSSGMYFALTRQFGGPGGDPSDASKADANWNGDADAPTDWEDDAGSDADWRADAGDGDVNVDGDEGERDE